MQKYDSNYWESWSRTDGNSVTRKHLSDTNNIHSRHYTTKNGNSLKYGTMMRSTFNVIIIYK